jgi:rhodanese-related sulfurtransferase
MTAIILVAVSCSKQETAAVPKQAAPVVPINVAGKEFGWTELAPLATNGKVVLVDARHEVFYQSEHIPGAISIPSNVTEERMAEIKKTYLPGTALVVYCSEASCEVASFVAERLRTKYGFTNVGLFPGGLAEWAKAAK